MSKMLYRRLKRILDIIISLTLILILSPLLLLISFFVWIQDRGPVFVQYPRRLTGKNMDEFFMFKFRSMRPNAHEEILNNPEYSEIKEKWLSNDRKLRVDEDPRLTLVGKFLRRTDLDELPQLFNVLKGDMSIIGPRPMYMDEIVGLEDEYQGLLKDVFSVKPGMSSLWAVSGRNDISFRERIKIESEYSKSLSFGNDLKILLKTPLIVLTRKGAYE